MANAGRHVLVLSLMQERMLDDNISQLMDSLRLCVSVILVETTKAFRNQMKAKTPFAVLVIDSAISKSENTAVLSQLVQYVQGGGTVVCCCNFSNHISYDYALGFFSAWGLPWDAGSYLRTTVHLNPNPNSVIGMELGKLPSSYSIKSLYLTKVPPQQAIYNPSRTSCIESRVFASDLFPIDPRETPCAYGRVGSGYFGYVGDVNNEEGSTRVVMAMVHLPDAVVVPDKVDRTSGLVCLPDGSFKKAAAGGDPNAMVMFSDAIRQAGQDMQSGAKMGKAGDVPKKTAMAAPPASSTAASSSKAQSRSSKRNPPRAREAEVETRAKKRANNSTSKLKEGESVKEEGNVFFKAGDYQGAIRLYKQAIAIRGPESNYQSNLAAAYLKLSMFEEAEEESDIALKHDPKNLKARYRRASARLGMLHFRDAMNDFKACAKLAPRDPQFTAGIAKARAEYNATKAAGGIPDSDQALGDEKDTDYSNVFTVFELDDELHRLTIESESDSSDFEHEGNGRPCRAYNHEGCKNRAASCKFKHAPTKGGSVRDELGRNVCSCYLSNACKEGNKCVYSHDKEYLPEHGWWKRG